MKPFKRIIRPIDQRFKQFGYPHLLDDRYCKERLQLIHSYHLLLNDFKKIFDYIELDERNKKTFSHRIYELILRCCTEFETNAKGILNDNGYKLTSNKRQFDVTDYFKINKVSKLNEYQVCLSLWTPNELIITPFSEWNSDTYSSLSWYQSYNKVKHDRFKNFEYASLENLIHCLAGLTVLLASQFSHFIFDPYHEVSEVFPRLNTNFISHPNCIFSFKYPEKWSHGDIIAFDWNKLQEEDNPFVSYDFT